MNPILSTTLRGGSAWDFALSLLFVATALVLMVLFRRRTMQDAPRSQLPSLEAQLKAARRLQRKRRNEEPESL